MGHVAKVLLWLSDGMTLKFMFVISPWATTVWQSFFWQNNERVPFELGAYLLLLWALTALCSWLIMFLCRTMGRGLLSAADEVEKAEGAKQ